MPEYVSRALRKLRDAGAYSAQRAAGGAEYAYEIVADVFRLPETYFERGVVAFTDAVRTIVQRSLPFIPYKDGIHADGIVRDHELEHIARRKKSLPQNEAEINSVCAYRRRLQAFPFPSY